MLVNHRVCLSIVIPVYMVEAYLSECVGSLLCQTYPDIEVILVDDGSKDRSSLICDQYAEKYKNVKVIHKENGGLSDARNFGIQAATGDYIAFLDGDDFYDDPEAINRLVKRLELTKPDVLNFSFIKFDEGSTVKTPYFKDVPDMPVELKDKKNQTEYLADHRLYISSACNKLIKRELFDSDMYFVKGEYSEDIVWSAKLLCKAQSMDFVCENFYCYRQRQGSISHSINDKMCDDLTKHILQCVDLYKNADDEIKELLGYYTAYQFGTFFLIQARAVNDQGRCVDQLKEYTYLLQSHKGNKKLRVLSAGCKILGFKNICKMIRFVYRLRK